MNPYINLEYTLQNGSKIIFNKTLGLLTTIKIINKTNSPYVGKDFISTKTFTINGENYTGPPATGSEYIRAGFKDSNSAKTYYAKVQKYFTNSTTVTYTYDIKGEYYYFFIDQPSLYGENSFFENQTWNWKTGWEKSDYILQKFGNGSVLVEYQEDLINYSPATNGSNGISGFTIIPLIIAPLILVKFRRKKT